MANNSEGQYVQVLGSTKVSPGVKGTGERFVFAGLYDKNGNHVPVPDRWKGLVTSMVFPNQWCCLSESGWVSGLSTSESAKHAAGHVLQTKRKYAEGVLLKDKSLSCMTLLQSDWMRDLLQDPRAPHQYTSPVNDLKFWPSGVQEVVLEGGASVIFCARLNESRVCWRRLTAGTPEIVKHSQNKNGLALCVLDKSGNHHLFTRCFSLKCGCIGGPAWAQLAPSHLRLLQDFQAEAPSHLRLLQDFQAEAAPPSSAATTSASPASLHSKCSGIQGQSKVL